jgi:hypothetical protein
MSEKPNTDGASTMDVAELASLGGKTAAAKMTPEQRQERAKQAAAARWRAGLPVATHGDDDHPLRIGAAEIGCYVLNDGRRVISQRGLQTGIGMNVSGGAQRLLKLVGVFSSKGVDCKELTSRISDPIKFLIPAGVVAHGYEATALADLCDVILEARKAGILSRQQIHVADHCEILVRSFAKIGIVALIDEATGYQDERARDALAKILEAYIAKELRPWLPTFQPDFYKQMFRLRSLPYNGTVKRPQYIGCLTNDVVYERLAPGVLTELKRKNPADENGRRKNKHFQWLTANHGHPELRAHLKTVTALMLISDNWKEFYERLNRALPKQIQMPLFDWAESGANT